MQQLLSISEKKSELDKFGNDWEAIRHLVETEGLDGIELVFGDARGETAIPAGLVRTVHLPMWLGWIKTWTQPESVPVDCDPFEVSTYYGAANPEDLMSSFIRNLDRVAELNGSYALLHIGHVELDEVYTQVYRYSSKEVLSGAASFLNEMCSRYPGGKPPVTIAFENLWSTGLTFRSEEEIRFFVDLLEFDDWIFVLDTGHLMNGLKICSEQEGIRKVLRTLSMLSNETIEKIRSVHFQCSTSGLFQKTHLGRSPPPSFRSKSYIEKFKELMQYLPHVDEHRPFSDPACRDIIDLVEPDFLVHEIFFRSLEELRQCVRQQKALVE